MAAIAERVIVSDSCRDSAPLENKDQITRLIRLTRDRLWKMSLVMAEL